MLPRLIGRIIVLIMIATVVGLSLLKISRDRKNGVKCSGCPYSKTCGANTTCSDNSQFTTHNSQLKTL
ncbi:FeoB-associated Cys-rich membrane protein [Gudongella sp. SC589]|uniref:FeoB-associated Cys-rich membrane protein n=1 Tax=Gudongella sp. SC589 TaxID=3385990 RepID=UPI003904AC58